VPDKLLKDVLMKIVILNDFKEEQLSLFSTFFDLSFKPSYRLSVGCDYLIKSLTINDFGISMRFWVLHIEERFRFLLTTFLKGTRGILIMCDITREREIREIDLWLKNILSYRDDYDYYRKIPTILVGYITNDEKPKISYEEIGNLAKSYKLDGYQICNLQTGENIEIIFETLARDLIDLYL
jgi:GTPase SAR1 family protein